MVIKVKAKKVRKKRLREYIESIINNLVYAIIAGVVAAALFAWITDSIKRSNEKDQLLSNLGQVYIGSSKEWIDDSFGPPNFTAKVEDYLLCGYFKGIFALQAIYDESKSVQAFFITSLSNNESNKLNIVKPFYNYPGGDTLGEFSYYDIPDSPMGVYGYVSQGPARALYGEYYYYNSAGNYYLYYYLTLDYGTICGSFEDFIQSLELRPNSFQVIDDEVSTDSLAYEYGQFIRDRKKAYPNTYGVSNTTFSDISAIDIITDYNWYDTKQIRDRNAGFN